MDNIIDFKKYVQQRLIHEALPELPDIPIIEEASSIFGDIPIITFIASKGNIQIKKL